MKPDPYPDADGDQQLGTSYWLRPNFQPIPLRPSSVTGCVSGRRTGPRGRPFETTRYCPTWVLLSNKPKPVDGMENLVPEVQQCENAPGPTVRQTTLMKREGFESHRQTTNRIVAQS
jgi:hypothetical protein